MKNIKLLTTSLLMSTFITGVAEAQSIDYGMMESIFGEPVTASATGKPQRASDAPVSMNIIGTEEIRRSGAKDIPQLLRRVAGVQVQRSAIGRADVSIRGYNKPYANRLLVLVNGRQILSDAFGQTNWETLAVSMNEIRQIEVVKGPQSSLFGFNAESGVINIITHSPLKDDINVAQVKMGTQGHKQADAVTTAQFDNKAVRVSLGSLDSDAFDRSSITDGGSTTVSTLRNEQSEWLNRRVAMDYEWQVDDSSNVRFQSTFGKSKTRGIIPYAGMSQPNQDQFSNHISYAKQSDYGLIGVNAYRMSDNWANGTVFYENDLNVLKMDDLFKIGTDHSVRLAAEYRHNVLKGKIVGGGNSKFDFDLYAPSAMWDWKMNDELTWTNSVRYDHVQYGRDESPVFGTNSIDDFDRSIEEVSYNSSLVYKPNTADTFRASVSRGLHIPSLVELGSGQSLAPLPAGFAGNPGLEPERIVSLEFGWDKKLPEHNMNFTSAIFLQKVENVLGDDIVLGAPTSFTFENFGDSTTYGLELGLDGVHDNWLRWGANYTYLKTNDDDAATGLFYEEAQPKHQITLLAGFDHKNWEFDTDLHYISSSEQTLESNLGFPTTLSEKVDGYFVLNARAGYNYSDSLNVAIEGYNLVDRHREWMYAQGATGGPIGGNILGRSVLVSLTYKF